MENKKHGTATTSNAVHSNFTKKIQEVISPVSEEDSSEIEKNKENSGSSDSFVPKKNPKNKDEKSQEQKSPPNSNLKNFREDFGTKKVKRKFAISLNNSRSFRIRDLSRFSCKNTLL